MKGDKHNRSGSKPSGGEMNDLRLEAARKRLAESKGQEDAIEGLREIVANFIGSEEIVLFKVDRRNATFHVFWAFGIDPEDYDLPRALGDAGLQHVMRGECHVEAPDHNRSNAVAKVKAFIPLRFANQTVAILAILRLLPQKVGFDRFDMELFKVLSDQAAKPLFGPNAQSSAAAGGSGIRA